MHPRNPAKIKSKEHLKVLVFFCIEKFKKEEGRGNVTLNVAAQAVKLDCGFGPRPVLSFSGLV